MCVARVRPTTTFLFVSVARPHGLRFPAFFAPVRSFPPSSLFSYSGCVVRPFCLAAHTSRCSPYVMPPLIVVKFLSPTKLSAVSSRRFYFRTTVARNLFKSPYRCSWWGSYRAADVPSISIGGTFVFVYVTGCDNYLLFRANLVLLRFTYLLLFINVLCSYFSIVYYSLYCLCIIYYMYSPVAHF